MKKLPKKLAVLLIVAAVLAAVILCVVLYMKHGFSQDEQGKGRGAYAEASFTIESGDYLSDVATGLQDKGIIRFAQHFRSYGKKTGLASQLQVGTFQLNNGMSYDEIFAVLTAPQGRVGGLTVTIPEGSTALKIADLVSEQTGLCTPEEFLDVANNGDFSKYWWWSEIPTPDAENHRFMKAEGYLLPNTYDMYKDATVYELVDRFYSAFNDYLTDAVQAQLKEKNMSVDDMVILGSMIQEEAGNAEDAKVSSVFHNRLAQNYPLESNVSSYVQSDADNNYVYNWIAKYYGGWNQIPAGMAEAYDTYKVVGLPAGPVSCPGADALDAALNPAQTDYFYFVTDAKGQYYYAVTYQQHLANCAKCGY